MKDDFGESPPRNALEHRMDIAKRRDSEGSNKVEDYDDGNLPEMGIGKPGVWLLHSNGCNLLALNLLAINNSLISLGNISLHTPWLVSTTRCKCTLFGRFITVND
jgi:hypothetical protein